MEKKIAYRIHNYYAEDNRVQLAATVHPDLLFMLQEIARHEHKSISWVVETGLADYFGCKISLRKCKHAPRPDYDSLKEKRKRA